MKSIRAWLCGALVMTGALIPVACAKDVSGESYSGVSSSPVPDDPLRTLLSEAAHGTQNLASAHLTLVTTGQIDALSLIAGGQFDVQTSPLASTGTVTYDGQLNVPFSLVDGNVSVKLFDEWTRIGTVDELIPEGLLDPRKGIAAIADEVVDPQQHGTEEVDGIRTLKVTGTIPVQAARIMLPDTDKSHTVTAWIREDDSHDIVRTLVDVGPGQTIETTLSKWNVAVDVAAPVAAK